MSYLRFMLKTFAGQSGDLCTPSERETARAFLDELDALERPSRGQAGDDLEFTLRLIANSKPGSFSKEQREDARGLLARYAEMRAARARLAEARARQDARADADRGFAGGYTPPHGGAAAIVSSGRPRT